MNIDYANQINATVTDNFGNQINLQGENGLLPNYDYNALTRKDKLVLDLFKTLCADNRHPLGWGETLDGNNGVYVPGAQRLMQTAIELANQMLVTP